MDQATVLRIAKQYSELIRQEIPLKMAILYGSYAKGTAKEDSDIDIAFIVDRIEDDYLASQSKLFKIRREVDDRIEPVLLEDDNDLSGFLEEVKKTGMIIYSQSQIQ